MKVEIFHNNESVTAWDFPVGSDASITIEVDGAPWAGATFTDDDAWLAARAERDTGRVESPSSKAGPVPPAGPADEDDSLFARAFRAEMARSS